MTIILVVDDNEENLYLLQTILSKNGYEILQAKEGGAALSIARETKPDLVISDILMPGMDGFSFCRAWKNDSEFQQIPFVFYTATYTGFEDKEFAFNLGADGFITKPIEPDEFIQAVRSFLEQTSVKNSRVEQIISPDESIYYRMYNDILIHKLEDKLLELEQSNKSLTESESNYKYLFEHNPLPMWIYDLETLMFLNVNDSAIHYYGYSREEFLSMTLKDIRPVEDIPELSHNIAAAQQLYQFSGPWRHQLKNGRIIYVEITSHAIKYNERAARFVMAQDITERKNTEDALRLQSAALNSAANSILITDINGKIVWANPAFSRLSGYSSAETIGKNPRQLLFSNYHGREFYQKMWNTILAGEVWHGEIVNRRKDGSFYDEEQSITPVRNAWGVISHFVAIKQDISDRKKSEKLLYESEARLRLALNAANQGLYDLNVQTGETIVNDIYASMLGYDPETFVETNANWLERLHPDDREPASKVYLGYINGEVPEYRVEFRQRALSGEWKWILSIGSIVERDKNGLPLRLLGTHTDITESKKSVLEIERLLTESQRRLQRIGALRSIDTAISTNLETQLTLRVILDQVIEQLKVDAAVILLFNADRQTLDYASSLGFHSNRIENAQVKIGESLAGTAAAHGQMVRIRVAEEVEIDVHFAALLQEEGIEIYFGLPLFAKGNLKGILELYHRSELVPDEEWLHFYETLAGQAAVAIENAQLFENLQVANEELVQAYNATIEGWSKALDLRDKETEGHTQRVMVMTMDMASLMGFSVEEMVHIRRGALLHDIGKMGVPDAILHKTGSLTEEEWEIMHKHTLFAYDMLFPITYLRPALEIPCYHHEKWDGSGYPFGLKGEQIPLTARLFAIVDVYDALTSERPYRKAWSHEKALAHILVENGSHFDPMVVEKFLAYINEKQAQ
ncbi:MAG: hypothetical protein CVU39_28555 [Chloroflexi bacterium HGW-Chloroflexi-10]|nr:MAG: hypothetical protein CVU39_28555 [Chloroflexi bacterium HGW-Chloroflexi-10]